jgi:tRNA/rRNA methyltransferase
MTMNHHSEPDLGLWRLGRIRIVLVEPAGPLNVGSVARVMKNMALGQLVLVNPHCDIGAEPARRMAVHGIDVLQQARVVDTLPAALVGCQRAVATTGRLHPQQQLLEPPETVLPWLWADTPETGFDAAIIFGPEDRGLSNDELRYAQRWVRIPVSEAYPSLNLAQAVAVCSYLLHRLATEAVTPEAVTPEAVTPEASPEILKTLIDAPERAAIDQLEVFFQDLETVLLKIGYLYPHTATSRMAKFRRLLHRAAPNHQELAMLRGVLRQVNWALTTLPPEQ